MKKLILTLLLCVAPMPTLAESSRAFLDCSLTWTPIIPCSDARYDSKPVITFKILKPERGSKRYSVKRHESYPTYFCGTSVFSEAREVVKRSKIQPVQNSRKYIFESLTVYKKKGTKSLDAEMKPFGRNVPLGLCQVAK